MKDIVAYVNDYFQYSSNVVESGTRVEIAGVIENPISSSQKSFIISKCDRYPQLESVNVSTAFFDNAEDIIAKLVKDVYDATKLGLDPHKWKASYRLGINYSDVTLIQREQAKKQNFKEAYKMLTQNSEVINSYKFNRKLLLLL